MGFFREDRFGGFSGLSYLSNLEKLHTVFMDVETEGRARGYELAAEKYKEAFSRIQKEYNELKKNIDEQIQNTGNLLYKKKKKCTHFFTEKHPDLRM